MDSIKKLRKLASDLKKLAADTDFLKHLIVDGTGSGFWAETVKTDIDRAKKAIEELVSKRAPSSIKDLSFKVGDKVQFHHRPPKHTVIGAPKDLVKYVPGFIRPALNFESTIIEITPDGVFWLSPDGEPDHLIAVGPAAIPFFMPEEFKEINYKEVEEELDSLEEEEEEESQELLDHVSIDRMKQFKQALEALLPYEKKLQEYIHSVGDITLIEDNVEEMNKHFGVSINGKGIGDLYLFAKEEDGHLYWLIEQERVIGDDDVYERVTISDGDVKECLDQLKEFVPSIF